MPSKKTTQAEPEISPVASSEALAALDERLVALEVAHQQATQDAEATHLALKNRCQALEDRLGSLEDALTVLQDRPSEIITP